MLDSLAEILHFFVGGAIVGLVMIWLWVGETEMCDIVTRLRKRREAEMIGGYERVEWEDEEAIDSTSLIDRLRAENERLRAALKMFAEHFGPLEDNIMLHDGARRCFAVARAALEEKP